MSDPFCGETPTQRSLQVLDFRSRRGKSHEVPCNDIRDEDVRDVLLSFEDDDPRVGQHGSHHIDSHVPSRGP